MRVVSIVGLLVVLSSRISAITLAPLTFEELVEGATAIVYARVADVEGQWTGDRRGIESHIRLEPLRYLKGHLGASVMTRLPGGEAGGRIHVLPGAPVLREGDLVVLFLASKGPSVPVVFGLSQGVFRAVLDSAGNVIVTPPPLKAGVPGRIVRGAASRKPLSLDAFASEVRGVLEAAR